MISMAHKNALFIEKLDLSPQNVLKYNKYRNILGMVIRIPKKKHYQQEFAKHSSNSRETWKTLQTLIKSKQKTDTAPKKVINDNGDSVTDDANIAETFNTFFTEIGEKLSNSIPHSSLDPLELISNIDDEMNLTLTSEEELVRIIDGLKNVGAGVDNINAKIFKLSYKCILRPLLHLFNTCLSVGIFPSVLKVAVIKPIFKSGNQQHVNNYRPISILPFI